MAGVSNPVVSVGGSGGGEGGGKEEGREGGRGEEGKGMEAEGREKFSPSSSILTMLCVLHAVKLG